MLRASVRTVISTITTSRKEDLTRTSPTLAIRKAHSKVLITLRSMNQVPRDSKPLISY
jgi:hypothetical protein